MFDLGTSFIASVARRPRGASSSPRKPRRADAHSGANRPAGAGARVMLDSSKTDPLTILGLAAAILAFGSVHWLVRDQDREDAAEQDQAQGTVD